MSKYKYGDVVIVKTGQAGTVLHVNDKEMAVLLRNRDIWYGQEYDARFPSSKQELKACPIDVDKWEERK